MNRLLPIALVPLAIDATTEDCIHFYSNFRQLREGTLPPIVCNDLGFCEPVFWMSTGENRVVADPMEAERGGLPVTCTEAATLRDAEPDDLGEEMMIDDGADWAAPLHSIPLLEQHLSDLGTIVFDQLIPTFIDPFPMGPISESERATVFGRIRELREAISELLSMNEDAALIRDIIITRYDFVEEWSNAISIMATSSCNFLTRLDSTRRELGWALIQQLATFQRILGVVLAPNQNPFSGPVPEYIASLWQPDHSASADGERHSGGLFSDDYEEAFMADHADCSACNAIRTRGIQPGQVRELIDALVDLDDEQHDASQVWGHFQEVMNMLRDSVMYREHMCYRADNLVTASARVLRQLDNDVRVRHSRIVIDHARRCRDELCPQVRREWIPLLLVRQFPDLSFRNPLRGARVITAQHSEVDGSFGRLSEFLAARNSLAIDLSELVIGFQGSEAQGFGPLFEYLTRAFTDLVQTGYELFEFTDEREVLLRPRPGGESSDDYRQVGRMLGLAIRHSVPINFPLSPACIAVLTGIAYRRESVSIDWLRSENPSKASTFDTIASMTESDLAASMLGPLHGRAVTRGNLDEYIREMVFLETIEPFEAEMLAISRGIYDVLPIGQLSWLSVLEVQEMITSPIGPIDVTDLFQGIDTETSGLPEEERGWLFAILHEMTPDEVKQFVVFVTGSPFPPLNGFSGLDGRRRWISVYFVSHSVDALPRAQLCFKQLFLTRYSTRETMKERIIFAIMNANSVENH